MKYIFLFSLIGLSACQQPKTEPLFDASVPDVQSKEASIVIHECPVGMVYVQNGNFCIDQFEWPNQKGTYPDFAMTAFEAEADCKSVNKRLCTHTEWTNACLGINNQLYGYGETWIKDNCNDSLTSGYIYPDWSKMSEGKAVWKVYAKTLYKGVPSGSLPNCYSQQVNDKIYNMLGNVREWVIDPQGLGGYSFESSFWFGTMEGEQGCGFRVDVHAPEFASYEVGTRCCLSVEKD